MDAVFANLHRMVCANIGVPPLSPSLSISVNAPSGCSWKEHSCFFPLCGFCLAGLPVLTEICFSLIQDVMMNSSRPLQSERRLVLDNRSLKGPFTFHPQGALWPSGLNRVHNSFPLPCFLNDILSSCYPVFKEFHIHCHIIFTTMRNKMIHKVSKEFIRYFALNRTLN